MELIALIALIAAAVVAVLAAIVVIVLVLIRLLRKVAQDAGAAARESFPDAVVGPELGQYRGGTGSFPRTRNTSWIVLTPHALAVRPLLGKVVSLSVEDITGTRMEKSFNTHWNGRPVLVIETARGELGLTIENPAHWEAALAR